jgi:hypothetical protein
VGPRGAERGTGDGGGESGKARRRTLRASAAPGELCRSGGRLSTGALLPVSLSDGGVNPTTGADAHASLSLSLLGKVVGSARPGDVAHVPPTSRPRRRTRAFTGYYGTQTLPVHYLPRLRLSSTRPPRVSAPSVVTASSVRRFLLPRVTQRPTDVFREEKSRLRSLTRPAPSSRTEPERKYRKLVKNFAGSRGP